MAIDQMPGGFNPGGAPLGGPPQQPGFPPPGGYGAPPGQPGGYGAPPGGAPGGYGAPPGGAPGGYDPMGGGGAPGGYGAPPPQQGYDPMGGGGPAPGGYDPMGGGGVPGGYGAPPQQGYGAPPQQQQGYGAPDPMMGQPGGGYGAPPQQGYGNPNDPMMGQPGGGYGAPAGGPLAAPGQFGGPGGLAMPGSAGLQSGKGPIRNPVTTLLFSCLCFFYGIFAMWTMLNELQQYTKDDDFKPWFMFVPLLNYYFLWVKVPEQMAKAKQMAGSRNPQPQGFIMYFLLVPYALAKDLNQVWDPNLAE